MLLKLLLLLFALAVTAYAEPGHIGAVSISASSLGPSGTLNISATNADFTGRVSGTFVGDGSGLTNLPVSATVSATTLSATNVNTHYLSATSIAGTLSTGDQPNITSLGVLTGLTASGEIDAQTLSGTNVYGKNASFTSVVGDGSGLTNVSASSVGYSNIQNKPAALVSLSSLSPSSGQYITFDGTTYQGTSDVTATSMPFTGLTNVPAGISNISNSTGSVTATTLTAVTINGQLATAAQPNVTSVGTLTGLEVQGTASVTTLTFSSCPQCGVPNPSWYSLTGIPSQVQSVSDGLVVSTTTHNGHYASFTTLTAGAAALGPVSATNISSSANVSAGKFIGDGSLLSGLQPLWNAIIGVPQPVIDLSNSLQVSVTTLSGTNVYGRNASFTTVAGTLSTAAQPNVTSLGNLTGLQVNGTASATNVYGGSGSFTTVVGTLSTASQPNITSLGSLTGLTVNGSVSASQISATNASLTTIQGTLTTASQPNITSLGTLGSLNVTNAVTAATVTATNIYGNAGSLTTLTVGGQAVTSTPSWYSLQNIPTKVQDISTGLIVSVTTHNGQYASFTTIAGTISTATQNSIQFLSGLTAVSITGNLSVTTINGAVPVFGGAPSWYTITSVPAQVQAVSNSDGINLSSLGVSGAVTATTLSGTYQYGQYASFTTINGQLSTAAQPNVTSLGTLTGLTVNGTTSSTNSYAQNASYTALTVGGQAITSTPSWYSLTNTPAVLQNISNSTGSVTATTFTGSLVSATTLSGTLATSAQPNVTSVGTLTGLTVNGTGTFTTVTATNVYGSSGSFTTVLGTLSTAAQPNVTSVGTLTGLAMGGNLTGPSLVSTSTGGTVSASNVYVLNVSASNILGTLTTAAQPNITSVGTLSSLSVGAITASGNITGSPLVSTSSAGKLSATYVYGNQASFTTVNMAACTGAGCGGSPTVIDANIISGVIKNNVSATNASATTLYANTASFTTATIAGNTYTSGTAYASRTYLGNPSAPGYAAPYSPNAELVLGQYAFGDGGIALVTQEGSVGTYAASYNTNTMGTYGNNFFVLNASAQAGVNCAPDFNNSQNKLEVCGGISATNVVKSFASMSGSGSSPITVSSSWNLSGTTITRAGTGRYVFNFPAGVFNSSVVIPACSAVNGSTALAAVKLAPSTATSITIYVANGATASTPTILECNFMGL